jgi:hypothetical protein
MEVIFWGFFNDQNFFLIKQKTPDFYNLFQVKRIAKIVKGCPNLFIFHTSIVARFG